MSLEPVFDVDEFNNPKLFEGAEADVNLLYHIITGRSDVHVTPDVCFNIQKYRFKDLEQSASDIETRLRNHIDTVAPEIYLNSIDIKTVDDKKIYLTMNVYNDTTGKRNSILFKITNKDNTKLLVDLV